MRDERLSSLIRLLFRSCLLARFQVEEKVRVLKIRNERAPRAETATKVSE